jgi:mutator protein MutT
LQPRVGCGAAIADAAGRLLLVQRRREPEAGHWGLPGGKLDFGESVQDCIRREILEELGIVITLGPLLCVTDYRTPQAHWVAPVHRAEIASGTPQVQEPEALAACGWFAPDDLPHPLTRATVQALAAMAG